MGLTKPEDYITTSKNPMHTNWRFRPILALIFAFCSACTPARFFYLPNRHLYSDPKNQGIWYDTLEIPSLNGKTLSAILFKTPGPPKGTVVHLHGNFGNVSCHYMQSQYLTTHGFDVLVVDYQGYGGSEGRVSPKNTIDDGIAAIRWAEAHRRPGAAGVVLLGQSLGASVATVVAAKEPLVKAVVLESPFYSYRSIARDVLKRSVFTWILYPIYPLFLGTTYDPWKFVGKISPRPTLFIHGTADNVVPGWMTDELATKAKKPYELWVIDGAGHLECKRKKGAEYEKRVADFFSAALQK